nr:PREDICTED: keratin, type II cytoskeletal 2 epidermal-like [Anolis carolinensis]|eukprot:XP_008121872.1 PREDICTED: keratin, type II cytoskeletal 2 epidermal-like [Anolis carolinensis]
MRKAWAAWSWTLVLLVALWSESAVGRRGGGRGSSSKGRGSGVPSSSSSSSSSRGGGFHSLPKKGTGQSQGVSGRGAKVAGAAAIGAAVGYGLSSLGRSRYSRGGHSYSSASKPAAQPGFQNPTWSDMAMEGELHSRASEEASKAAAVPPILCGVAFFFLLAQG